MAQQQQQQQGGRGYYQQEQKSSSNFQNLLNAAGREQIVRFRPQLHRSSSYVVPNKNNTSPPRTIKSRIIEAKASVLEEGVKLGRHNDDDPELKQSNKTTNNNNDHHHHNNKNNNNNNNNKRKEEEQQQFVTKLQDEAIKAINRTTLLGSTPAGIVDHSNQDQYQNRRPPLFSSSSSSSSLSSSSLRDLSPSNRNSNNNSTNKLLQEEAAVIKPINRTTTTATTTALLGSTTLQAPIVNHLNNQDQHRRPASSSGNLIPSRPTNNKLLQEKEPNYSSPLIHPPHPAAALKQPLIHNNYILKTNNNVDDPNDPERKDFAHRVINWRKADYYQGRNWPINPIPKTQDHYAVHQLINTTTTTNNNNRTARTMPSPMSLTQGGGIGIGNNSPRYWSPDLINGSSSYGYNNNSNNDINSHTSTAIISSDQAANKYKGAFIF